MKAETVFTINGVTYKTKKYTNKDVATILLPQIYGENIKFLTYGHLALITKMLNHGWDFIPGYMVDFENNVKVLKPNFNWFNLWCDYNGVPERYTCYIHDDNVVDLFVNGCQIAQFLTIDAMFEYVERLEDTEPIKCVEYSDSKTDKNLDGFDKYGLDGEIYTSETKVFDYIVKDNFKMIIDANKWNKIDLNNE